MSLSTTETQVPPALEMARLIAAQCWCDQETQHIEMDTRLAEAFAKRLAPWIERVLPPREAPASRMTAILDAVSYIWRIPNGAILAKSRTPVVVEARHAFCWLVRRHTPFSLPVIAKFLANRDHGSISNGQKRALELWETDPEFRRKIKAAEGRFPS